MIRLYGMGTTRWTRPYWTLKELGVPFEPVPCKPIADTHKPEFLAKNPFGKVPYLEDGDVKLFESAAMCLYLAERYGDGKLLPPPGTAERAQCLQWTLFAAAELEAPLWRITKNTFIYPEGKRIPADVERATEEFLALARPLEHELGDYAAGNRFTVADVLLTTTLRWAGRFQLLGDFPKLRGYAERHSAREHFPRELYS